MPYVAQGKAATEHTLLVKGAPEAVLERCSQAMLADGSIIKMDDGMRKAIIAKVENEYNSDQEALRCLAHAFKDGADVHDKRLSDPSKFKDIESDLVFVGVAGILDPPRIEVKAAIEKCKSAGIRVIVITGDNQKTAEAICRMIGVFDKVFPSPSLPPSPCHTRTLSLSPPRVQFSLRDGYKE
jgi:magnesium-transporting ATPase (P-type)